VFGTNSVLGLAAGLAAAMAGLAAAIARCLSKVVPAKCMGSRARTRLAVCAEHQPASTTAAAAKTHDNCQQLSWISLAVLNVCALTPAQQFGGSVVGCLANKAPAHFMSGCCKPCMDNYWHRNWPFGHDGYLRCVL
jgi:hypothetical protein